jgi:signal peptidase II
MIFILFVYARLERSQKLLAIALALVMGGAVGNFIDRIRFDYVIDFLDVYVGSYRWPTFNVADIAISVGVFFLFADMVVVSIRQKKERAAADQQNSEDKEDSSL